MISLDFSRRRKQLDGGRTWTAPLPDVRGCAIRCAQAVAVGDNGSAVVAAITREESELTGTNGVSPIVRVVGLLPLSLFFVTACAGPDPADSRAADGASVDARRRAAAEPPRSHLTVTAPTPAPESISDPAQRLLAEVALEEQERRASSIESMRQAERLTHELRYAEAAGILRGAQLRDPYNEELHRRLQQLQFLLGERSGEIQEFTRELRDLAQVRDQQMIAELHLLYEEGVRLLDETKFAEASRVFDRLITRLDTLDARQPLSFGERVRALRDQARAGTRE